VTEEGVEFRAKEFALARTEDLGDSAFGLTGVFVDRVLDPASLGRESEDAPSTVDGIQFAVDVPALLEMAGENVDRVLRHDIVEDDPLFVPVGLSREVGEDAQRLMRCKTGVLLLQQRDRGQDRFEADSSVEASVPTPLHQ
jgi:hypothetical protein